MFYCQQAHKQDKKISDRRQFKEIVHGSNAIILIHGLQSKQKKIYIQLADRYARMGLDCILYSLPFSLRKK